MNFLKKMIFAVMVVVMLIMTTSCNKEEKIYKNGFMKDFTREMIYDNNIPDDYKIINWNERAEKYDELVYNFNSEGAFLPLIWEDNTYNTFGIPAYVGDNRMNQDGSQEGVTTIASVLSASLVGIDKSNQNSINYVEKLNSFFNKEEGIIVNNPAGSSETTSMWYLLYPAILYTQVSLIYDNNTQMRENVLTTIDSWYHAYEVMYNNGNPDFDFTGFNFKTNTPYRNGIWKEPDCAVGIAMLTYYGYELTNDQKYLTATINLMDYIEQFFGSPQYEVLMYYAPYLAAKLNALHKTEYDLTKALNRVFDGAAIPRGGWGSIVGQWGNYDVNGLFGSTTDGGGYAFAMNTFAASGAITPMIQYDARYAKSIGIWMLNLASNSRYFFASQTDENNQSCNYIEMCKSLDDIKDVIPYEGIRKQSNGKTPWFGGDPTVYGWAQTDLSLYSGAHIGILASLIEKTNVDKILKIDLQKTQLNLNDYPTYLLYNPYKEVKTIEYKIKLNGEVDLFNTVTNKIIKSNVSNVTNLDIPSNDALVIVEIPSNSEIVHKDNIYLVNDKYISSDHVTLNINGSKKDSEVKGNITLNLTLVGNVDDEIINAKVIIDNKEYNYDNTKSININTEDFKEGSKIIKIFIKTRKGLSDNNNIRLIFKK